MGRQASRHLRNRQSANKQCAIQAWQLCKPSEQAPSCLPELDRLIIGRQQKVAACPHFVAAAAAPPHLQ